MLGRAVRTGTSVGKVQMFRPIGKLAGKGEKKHIVLVVCFTHGLAATRCKDGRKESKGKKISKAKNKAIIRVICKWPLEVGRTDTIETLRLLAVNELTVLSSNL
jgi:hypothetical protein